MEDPEAAVVSPADDGPVAGENNMEMMGQTDSELAREL